MPRVYKDLKRLTSWITVAPKQSPEDLKKRTSYFTDPNTKLLGSALDAVPGWVVMVGNGRGIIQIGGGALLLALGIFLKRKSKPKPISMPTPIVP